MMTPAFVLSTNAGIIINIDEVVNVKISKNGEEEISSRSSSCEINRENFRWWISKSSRTIILKDSSGFSSLWVRYGPFSRENSSALRCKNFRGKSSSSRTCKNSHVHITNASEDSVASASSVERIFCGDGSIYSISNFGRRL